MGAPFLQNARSVLPDSAEPTLAQPPLQPCGSCAASNMVRENLEKENYTQQELGELADAKMKTIQRIETHNIYMDPQTG